MDAVALLKSANPPIARMLSFRIAFSSDCRLPRLTGRRYSLRTMKAFDFTFNLLKDWLGSRGGFTRAIACGALFALTPLPWHAQEITLHKDVKLVNVFVNVTDQNGAIIGGLTSDDFALTEDGRPQQIAVF
jgi:hypothetical protein